VLETKSLVSASLLLITILLSIVPFPPSSVHRMYHRTKTATRPSLLPLRRTKTAQKGAPSVWLCCALRGRKE
jgi:hypothetical protein